MEVTTLDRAPFFRGVAALFVHDAEACEMHGAGQIFRTAIGGLVRIDQCGWHSLIFRPEALHFFLKW
jgi:hypothetical protein